MSTYTLPPTTITGLILGIDADRTVTLTVRLWFRVADQLDMATDALITSFIDGKPGEEFVSIQCDAESGKQIADALRAYRAGVRYKGGLR